MMASPIEPIGSPMFRFFRAVVPRRQSGADLTVAVRRSHFGTPETQVIEKVGEKKFHFLSPAGGCPDFL